MKLFPGLFCAALSALVSASLVPPEPKLPVFGETALSPALKEEIRRETPGRLAALKARMDEQKRVVQAEMPKETFQCIRNQKRMEIAGRLFDLAERELARGNTDGLAFAFLYTEDLKRFCALFDDEIRWWRTYPTAPGVEPTVIRVADFGAKGDSRTDNIPAFDAAIAAAVKLAGRPSVIEIPAGDFRFSPTNRRTHLKLAGVTNCVLRGVSPEKTRLWFDDMDTCGTMITDAVNTTIENVDLASSRTPFFQGVVREFNKAEGWAVVEQEPGTMRPDDEIFVKGAKMGFCLGIFDENGIEAVNDGWQEMFYDRRAEDLGGGRFRIHLQADHFIYKRGYSCLRPGWNVVIPARKGFCQNASTGSGAYLCNYVNVWVRNGRGSSIAFCNGGEYSTAWRVHLKPLRKGLFTSSCADAIMNYRGTFIGECTFEQMNDDGANCHGLGRRIQRIENGDTVIADWLPGHYTAGDPMLIQSGQTGQYLHLGRVKRPGRDLRGGWIHNTTFEEKLPEGIRTLENLKAKDLTAAERQRQMVGGGKPDAARVPDLLYRPYLFGVGHVVYKSRFSSLRGSGAVLMCPNALLDEVTYEHMNRGVALTSLGHCGEGPSPYNVWIRNCTFRDCIVGVEGRVITASGRFADTAPVRGLTLEGCRFERVEEPLLLTNVGDDAEIQSGAAVRTMDRTKLLIGTYGLAPYARTEAHVRDLKDCGIDFVFGVPAKDHATLDLLAQYGLGAIATEAFPAWWGGNGDKAGQMRASVQNSSVQTVNQLGTATYAEHIDDYVRNVPLDYLSYDFYIYSARGDGRENFLRKFYDNFRITADACRASKKSLWFIPQVNSSYPELWPSENMLRFQAFTAMAFGAEVINWACWTKGWWTNNVLTLEGKRTEQYAKLKKVNGELHFLGPSYMRYRSTATHFTGFAPGKRLDTVGVKVVDAVDAGVFRGIHADDGSALVVGEMTPRKGCGRGAVLIVGSDDPYDEANRSYRVSFRVEGTLLARDPRNVIDCRHEPDGSWSAPLRSNSAVLIEAF